MAEAAVGCTYWMSLVGSAPRPEPISLTVAPGRDRVAIAVVPIVEILYVGQPAARPVVGGESEGVCHNLDVEGRAGLPIVSHRNRAGADGRVGRKYQGELYIFRVVKRGVNYCNASRSRSRSRRSKWSGAWSLRGRLKRGNRRCTGKQGAFDDEQCPGRDPRVVEARRNQAVIV